MAAIINAVTSIIISPGNKRFIVLPLPVVFVTSYGEGFCDVKGFSAKIVILPLQ